VERADMDAMIDLALRGVRQLCDEQARVLRGAGADLGSLLIARC
jgi:hypothetical protein